MVVGTVSSSIAGGVTSAKYDADISLMKKECGREIQGLQDLLNKANAKPKLYDRDYIDEENIDVDGLWKPVLERAIDPRRKVGIDKIQIPLDH